MGLFDRRRLPADVSASLAAHLDVPAGRLRVLAFAVTGDGYLVGLSGELAQRRPDGWQSWPWHRLLGASWSDDGATVTWRTVERPHALLSAQVTDPGRLPEVVRERVEQTIVLRRPVDLAAGVSGTLTGRRPADRDGEIEWSVLPPRGVDLRRPELAAAVDAVVARARGDWS